MTPSGRTTEAQRHRVIAPSQPRRLEDTKLTRRHRKVKPQRHRDIAPSQESNAEAQRRRGAETSHVATTKTPRHEDFTKTSQPSHFFTAKTQSTQSHRSFDDVSNGRVATARSRGIEARWTDHHVQARVDRIHLRLGSCLRHAPPASVVWTTPKPSPTVTLSERVRRVSRRVPRGLGGYKTLPYDSSHGIVPPTFHFHFVGAGFIPARTASHSARCGVSILPALQDCSGATGADRTNNYATHPQNRPIRCSAGVPPAPHVSTPPLQKMKDVTQYRQGGTAVLRAQRAGGSGWRDERLRSERQHDSPVAAVEDRSRLRRPRTKSVSIREIRVPFATLRCLCDVFVSSCLRVFVVATLR